MVLKTITYQDYNGENKTKDFMFSLSKADLILLNGKYGDIHEYAQRLATSSDPEDREKFFDFFFDDIISRAYGEKSADGEYFVKNAEKAKKFRYSPAMDELLIELLTKEDGSDVVAFIESLMPSDIINQINTSPALTLNA